MISHIDDVLESHLVVDATDSQKEKGKTNDQIMEAADKEVEMLSKDVNK